MSLIAMIIQIIYKSRVDRVLDSLLAKLTQVAYFSSLRGKIDFENLLVLKKTANKTFH